MPRERRRIRCAALLCLLVVGACSKWLHIPVPAPPAPMQTYPGQTRVTVRGQGVLELTNVVIATDSLFGLGGGVAELRVALPLRDVSRIETRVKSPGRTLLVLGAVLVALGFTGALGVGFK